MKNHLKTHLIQKENNQLIIAGKTAKQIIAIAGGTPCYIYDANKIKKQIASLKSQLPARIHLHYAVKANPFPPLVGQMATWVDGFDVASHQELLLALSCGMPSHKISLAGPGKSYNDLAAAILSGAIINVESSLELTRIYGICESHQCKANISLRINPDFELKHSGMSMGGGSKVFGIDAELAPKIISSIDTDFVNFKGLHIFSGSQNLNQHALVETHNKTFDLAYRLLDQACVSASQINIGGGFGIPYFENDKMLPLSAITDNLSLLMSQYQTKLNNAEIHLELGRYLVGSGGVYLSEIIDKKVSRGKTYLVVDGGMHHHLANSGNFGQVIRKNYPVLLANRIEDSECETVDVVGPLCTPLDILARGVSLPLAEVGDIFAVLQSGAYGASASPQEFLSQPKLRELLL
jgi:diaminopimelate decarboxylase